MKFPTDLAQRIVNMPVRHDNDNPLWQGPCAEGPLGGVTQSMIGRFLSCRERFRLKYVCGLEPQDRWNHRLGYGLMWHVCEEALALEDPRGIVIKTDDCWFGPLTMYCQQLAKDYPLQVEEIEKWYNVCCVQFPEYISYWSEHPDVLNRTPLLQEEVFDVPYSLLSGRVVRLRGRWDSVDLIDGGVWLQENKTKGDIDKLQVERQLSFDLQTMTYLIALSVWQNLDDYGDPIRTPDIVEKPLCGVRYNVVRRPLSGGKGNIKQHSSKNTRNTYTPAESEEQFYERLRRDYIAKEPDYWFFRIRSEISQRDMETFRKTCLDPLLEEMCRWHDHITGQDEWPCPTGIRNASHWRYPFGVYNALEEGGSTEYDAYMNTGSEVGLHRTQELFTELK